ncbi:beta-lactamase/transpeptidase-like protein [Ophiobolus disseminans]|uniref:Beta-lactamase/transpeptidase-like protein n=1 Tax=Ophiobolus disseminans TaxID=1469910 RepID=A0A6A6ZTX0_9PLEO|nr:beta-lactamase/transpeptidase-like protein [Ophiobolus disseminans]
MAEFEQNIKSAIAAQEIPGCALVSTNRNGSFHYAQAFGKTSVKTENAKAFQLDTTMWVASFTKLMTSICCMQLVEQGLVSLDQPVYKHIPELDAFPIISSIEEGTGRPIEQKNPTPITLRHLLTHSSGLTYDFMAPNNIAWLKYHGKRSSTSGKLLERYKAPLVFEPGTGWCYSPGIDYAGLLLERITGQSLESYMRANLWEPLDIQDATFFPSTRPDLKERMADQSGRTEDGKLSFWSKTMPWQDDDGNEATDCMGGQGSFTTAEEYLKVIRAVLTADEDEKILKKSTVQEFFKPQLSEGSKAMLNAALQVDWMNNAMGGTPKHEIKDWGLGGMLLMSDDDETGMKAGTMLWNGYPNMIWWVDPSTGICGLFATQVVPPGDAKVVAVQRKFEKEMYEQFKEKSGAPSRL